MLGPQTDLLRLALPLCRTAFPAFLRGSRLLATQLHTSTRLLGQATQYSAGDDEKILALREEGQAFSSIAEQLSFPRTAIAVNQRYYWLKRQKHGRLHPRRSDNLTSEDDKTILMLRSQNMTFRKIADRLSRSYQSVYQSYRNSLAKMNHTAGQALPPALTRPDAIAMLALRDQKLGWKEIAALYPGRPLTSLRKHAAVHKDVEEALGWSAEEDAKLAYLRSQGLTYRQIAEEHLIPGRTQLALQDRVKFIRTRVPPTDESPGKERS